MNNLVIVRSGGDIGTGVIQKIFNAGFDILILESKKPTSIRRSVCLSEAIFDGVSKVENLTAVKINNLSEISGILTERKIPIIIDEDCESVNILKPLGLIDAILAKKNLNTNKNMANITIGLGPGFFAGKDVDIVIETMRGHNLGRLIFNGYALENTGIPGNINGHGYDRVLRSPCSGNTKIFCKIGDIVKKGQVLGQVNNENILATIDGLLRGIIRDDFTVFSGMKIGDIDPRISEKNNCYTISDKARAIGGGVLEALLYLKNERKL